MYERRLGLQSELIYSLSNGEQISGGGSIAMKRADVMALFDGLKAEGE
jgi:hypothetical protein